MARADGLRVLINGTETCGPAPTVKPRPELLPARGVLAVASVMAAGQAEHDERWRTRTPVHHVGAALRHLLAWVMGETWDRGLHEQGHGKHSHLACAGARVLMALEIETKGA